MRPQDEFSPRQLSAAAFVCVLSPLVRRYPGALAATVGRTAWLSVAVLPLLLALEIAVLRLFYRRQPPHTGFSDILTASLGPGPGRVLTGLYGLWFPVYAGFLLRSGADRFISTGYPGAGPGVFVLVTAAICCLAAAGRTVALARTAMLFRPLLAALFAGVFLLSAKELDLRLLLPVTRCDVLPNVFGAAQLLNVLSAAGFLAFFSDRLSGGFHLRDWLGRALGMVLLIGSMTVGCLGVFGPALTARMSYPFFMLVRDLSAFGALERTEPVVIALWVLSDFVMISLLIQAAEKNLRFCFHAAPCKPASGTLLPTFLCTGLAVAVALAIPGDTQTFRLLSETVIPLVNAAFALLLPLPVLAVGLLRRKL